MDFSAVIPFLENNHRGVIGTRRENGATHSSIVVCGVFQNKAAFVSVYPKSQKIVNLRRNPLCTILAVTDSWREYVVIEGEAELIDYNNTNESKMRPLLRELYIVCSDSPHPNWEEYDEAMVKQHAVIVLVETEKVYGLLKS